MLLEMLFSMPYLSTSGLVLYAYVLDALSSTSELVLHAYAQVPSEPNAVLPQSSFGITLWVLVLCLPFLVLLHWQSVCRHSRHMGQPVQLLLGPGTRQAARLPVLQSCGR